MENIPSNTFKKDAHNIMTIHRDKSIVEYIERNNENNCLVSPDMYMIFYLARLNFVMKVIFM